MNSRIIKYLIDFKGFQRFKLSYGNWERRFLIRAAIMNMLNKNDKGKFEYESTNYMQKLNENNKLLDK